MRRGEENRGVVCAIVISALWGLTCAAPAVAAITAVGGIDPPYDNSDPWVLMQHLVVGFDADASLAISDGSRLVCEGTRVAWEADLHAGVQVTGDGSSWENAGTVFLGDLGEGTALISAGGSLTTPELVAGYEAGSVGNLVVTGPGTTWLGAPAGIITIDEDPPDGNLPSGTELFAIIGDHGTGNVTISDGARVAADRGLLYLGYWRDGVGHLTVTGPNSVWESTGTAHIGLFGTGTLLISDGAAVTSTHGAYIGASYWPFTSNPTSRGSVVVTDPNSVWRIAGGLHVADHGYGELLISAGGRVESDYAYVDAPGDAEPNLTVVTGTGSLWQNERYLVIGHDGRGWLRIEDGAQVTDANAFVGFRAGGNGLVQIADDGSTWASSAELHVGLAGEGTVSVEEGGRLTSRTGVLGTETTGVGLVTVTGPNSVWENVWEPDTGLGDLYVGGSGRGTLGIGSGGQVISHTAFVGYDATGEGEVAVDGADSLWQNWTAMQIGSAGTGRLSITDGGTVATQEAIVAAEPGSEGTITVEGPDSALEVDWGMILGSRGSATMSVSGGGHVETAGVTMGAETGSTASVTLTGPDTWWSDWGSTDVGVQGRADLLVSDGASLWAQVIMGIGTGAGGTGTVVVSGADSSVGGDSLRVGADGGQGSMTITDGAFGGGAEAWVGAGPGSLGEVAVSGPGSAWGATYNFWIGYYYGEGRLTVSDGAQVETLHGFIGWGPGSIGSVVVTGPDSLLRTSHALYVGGDENGPGGTASLGIYDEGLVDGNDVIVWPTGVVTGDGTLRADVVNQGTIRPGSSIGTLTIDGDLSVITDTSVIEFEIDNEGNCDKLLVSGFFGFRRQGLVPVPLDTLVGTHQYTVIEANGVEERIQTMEWPSPVLEPGLIRSTIAYGEEPNSILLRVTALAFDDPNIVRTCNQSSLGAALDRIAGEGGNDITTALQQLQTADEVRTAYGQLSGQTIPALAPVTVVGADRNVGMIAGRLHGATGGVSDGVGLGEPSADLMARSDVLGIDTGRYLFAVGNGTPVLGDRPWGVWGKGYGLYGDRESESGVPGYQYTVYGAAFGLDYRFTDRMLLGLTGGYSDGDIDFSGARDNSDVTATHGGLYAEYETSRWYLDAILAYAGLDYETRRYVDLVGERLEGDTSGDLFTGYVEAGLNHWRSGPTLIQPLAAFQFSTLGIDGFTETGGDGALSFDDERYESYKGSLGVKLNRRFFEHEDGRRMVLELRGRWVHEFGDTKATFDAGFANEPGVTFRVSDAAIARDSAVLGAGLDTWFTGRTRLFLDYGTELNPDNTIHLLTAGLEHRW